MWVYICAFSLSIISFLGIAKTNREHLAVAQREYGYKVRWTSVKCAVVVAALPIIFIAGVRYNVGTDYINTYYTGFYRLLEGSEWDNFEFGYRILNKMIQLFSNNVFILFFITAVIFVGFTYAGIYSLSLDIPLSIALFFISRYFFIGLNGVRQFIAMAILLYSIRYIFERKLGIYLIFSFLSFSFHYSALIFIPVYLVSYIDISPKKYIVLCSLGILILLFGKDIINGILSLTKYGQLLNRYSYAGVKFTLFTIVLNLFIIFVFFIKYMDLRENIMYRTYLNIQVLATLSTFALRTIPSMERIYWYFSFPLIVSFPYIIKQYNNMKLRKAITCTLFFLLGVYFIYDIIILRDHEVLPYDWFFGHSPIHYSGWYN